MGLPIVVGKRDGFSTVGAVVGNYVRGKNTEGINYPATGATSGTTAIAWATPVNVEFKDSLVATQTPSVTPTLNDYLDLKGFDFSAVPNNAVILGVAVTLEYWYNGGTTGVVTVDTNALIKGGTRLTSQNTGNTLPSSSGTNTTFGGSTSLWGTTLTGTNVKDSNFGFTLRLVNTGDRVANVNYASIQIWWTDPTGLIQTLVVGVNEVQANGGFGLIRGRKYVLPVVETSSMLFITQALKRFATTIIETEASASILSRARTMLATVTEAETVIVSLLMRMRNVPVSINEIEILATLLTKFKGLTILISETSSRSFNVLRSRGFSSLISEINSFTSTLLRARAVASAITENSTEAYNIQRNRRLIEVIAEAETVAGIIRRNRTAAFVISENETLSLLLSRVKNVTMAIAEAEAIGTLSLLRSRKLLSLISEAETLATQFNRVRNVPSTISESEAVITASERLREYRAQVVELTSFTAIVNRVRKMLALITEQSDSMYMLGGSGIRLLAMAITEASTYVNSLSRGRILSTIIAEVDAINIDAISRSRGSTALVAEIESLSVVIKRARSLITSVNESLSLSVEVQRFRKMTLDLFESQTDSMFISRHIGLAAAIFEVLASSIDGLLRLRAVSSDIPELETLIASVERLRGMGITTVEGGELAFNFDRLRGVVTEIFEVQGVTAGTLRRVRSIIQSINETYNYNLSLDVQIGSLSSFTLRARWEISECLENGEINLVPMYEEWDVTTKSIVQVVGVVDAETQIVTLK